MDHNHTIGIIWDLDGVLVDTGLFHYRSWQKALGKRGIPFTEDDFLKVFGRNNRSSLEVILGRSPTDAEAEEISREKEEIFRREIRGRAELLPGTQTLLEAFQSRGYAQAIGSSAPPENISQLIDELDIRRFFRAVVDGSPYPSKPHPGIFLAAAHELDAEPRSCLVIEDAIAGVEAARRAGMRCLAVATTNPIARLDRADMAVHRLDEVQPLDIYKLLELKGDHRGA